MPRKMRPAKHRRDQAPVSRALRTLLLWGTLGVACDQADADGTGALELFYSADGAHERAWEAIEAEAVREWVQRYPGTRPPSWWQWTAPELRRLTGGHYREIAGIGRCHETGVAYVTVTQDPLVESQAGLLERLGLWVPDERERVPAAAFQPERFSFDLLFRDTITDTRGETQ